MKNEILDDTTYDDLHNLLEDREKVIWEGSPSTGFNIPITFWTPGSSVKTKILDALILLIFLFLVFVLGSLIIELLTNWDFKNMISIPDFFSFLFVISLIIGVHFFSNHKQRKTKYIISNKRILFQLWKTEKILGQNFSLGHAEYYSIPFSEINNFYFVDENTNEGTILLAVKNPKKIPFDTYNFRNNERRDLPSLEMIENAKEVGEYIKMGIQEKL